MTLQKHSRMIHSASFKSYIRCTNGKFELWQAASKLNLMVFNVWTFPFSKHLSVGCDKDQRPLLKSRVMLYSLPRQKTGSCVLLTRVDISLWQKPYRAAVGPSKWTQKTNLWFIKIHVPRLYKLQMKMSSSGIEIYKVVESGSSLFYIIIRIFYRKGTKTLVVIIFRLKIGLG